MREKERAKFLKINLLKNNISQRSIAKDLGVSESYISMLISGVRHSDVFDSWVRKNLRVKI